MIVAWLSIIVEREKKNLSSFVNEKCAIIITCYTLIAMTFVLNPFFVCERSAFALTAMASETLPRGFGVLSRWPFDSQSSFSAFPTFATTDDDDIIILHTQDSAAIASNYPHWGVALANGKAMRRFKFHWKKFLEFSFFFIRKEKRFTIWFWMIYLCKLEIYSYVQTFNYWE